MDVSNNSNLSLAVSKINTVVRSVLALSIKKQLAFTKIDYETNVSKNKNYVLIRNLPKLSSYGIDEYLAGLIYIQLVYETSHCKYSKETNPDVYPIITCTYVPVYVNLYIPIVYDLNGTISLDLYQMLNNIHLDIPNNISYSIIIPAQNAYFFLPYSKLPTISYTTSNGEYHLFTSSIEMLELDIKHSEDILITTNKPYKFNISIPYSDKGHQGLIKAVINGNDTYLACLIKCGVFVVYDTYDKTIQATIPEQKVYFYTTDSTL